MRKILNKFLLFFLKIIHIIYPYKIMLKLQFYFNRIYSLWIRNEFINIGTDVLFQHPVTLLGTKFITIGSNVQFGKLCILAAHSKYYNQILSPCITIGDNCNFGEYNHITCINSITIGNNVLTGRFVTITDNAHGETNLATLQIAPISRKLVSKGKVIIGDNVWISDKVTILPGVKIGNGVIIAANSVVTKDIPNYCLAAGVPAKIIKSYCNLNNH